MIKSFYTLCSTISRFIHRYFPSLLFLSLLLLALDKLFPGSVSNLFDPALLFIFLFFVLLFSAFFPPSTQEDTSQRIFFYAIIGCVSVITLITITTLTTSLGIISTLIAALSTGIVCIILLFLILPTQYISTLQKLYEKEVAIGKNKMYQFLRTKLSIPLPIVCIVCLMLSISIYNILHSTSYESLLSIDNHVISHTITNTKPNDDLLLRTTIEIQNRGIDRHTFSDIVMFLEQNNFSIHTSNTAPSQHISNAIIKFNPNNQVVASYLIGKLKNMYPDVVKVTQDDCPIAKIVLMLGKPPVSL